MRYKNKLQTLAGRSEWLAARNMEEKEEKKEVEEMVVVAVNAVALVVVEGDEK